jgi:hypothetical protein
MGHQLSSAIAKLQHTSSGLASLGHLIPQGERTGFASTRRLMSDLG